MDGCQALNSPGRTCCLVGPTEHGRPRAAAGQVTRSWVSVDAVNRIPQMCQHQQPQQTAAPCTISYLTYYDGGRAHVRRSGVGLLYMPHSQTFCGRPTSDA